MPQTLAELKAIYIAWVMGAEIQVMHLSLGFWQEHDQYGGHAGIDSYYIWMAAHNKYALDYNKDTCERIRFRIKPEQTNAAD